MPGESFPSSSRGFETPLEQTLQLIKARGAFSYVLEQMGELSFRGQAGKLCQNFATWTADAPRIGKIPVDEVLECINQISFPVHQRGLE